MLASHTDEIDRYYEFRQGLRDEAPKPKIVMPPQFEQLITIIQTTRPTNFVTACLAPLDFDDDTRAKIARELEQSTPQASKVAHGCRVGGDDGLRGKCQ